MKRNKLLNIIKIISVCIISILPTNNALPFHHNYCKSDSDCHQPNSYCYDSRECVNCTECLFYNRQNNPAIKCAKNKDECGDCTLGTEAEFNFDGTFTCNPTFSNPPTIPINNNQNPVNSKSINYLALCISILCIAVLILLLIFLLKKYKICSSIKKLITSSYCSNNNTNNRIPPPPPYSEKNPSAPPEENPLITNQRILHEDNQRANMFHPPNWVNGGTFIDPYPPENHPETPASPVAEDENTQPSPWSPNSTDLSNSSEPTSFSNILSTSTPPDQPPNRSNTNNSESNQENTESSRSNPSLLIQVNISNNNIMNTAQVINEI